MTSCESKVLVTGANGFIGSVLSRALSQQGYALRTTSRTACGEYADHWPLDLGVSPCPSTLCTGIDTIFHLAGKAHALTENRQDVSEYQQINTEGTRKLLEAAQQAGVKRFIFFSSVKAVGDSLTPPDDETASITADTPYGVSKYLAEQLVLHGGYVPQPVVIRPSMVYGDTDKGNLPKMIKAIQRGVFPPLPELNNKRSMVHVADVVSAALLVMGSAQAAGQVYIVSDGQDYSTRQLYDWIRAALDKSPVSWAIPLPVLGGLAKLGDGIGWLRGKRFIFDSDALEKLTGSAEYSSAKITTELGFQPQYSLQESLPDIIRYLNLI